MSSPFAILESPIPCNPASKLSSVMAPSPFKLDDEEPDEPIATLPTLDEYADLTEPVAVAKEIPKKKVTVSKRSTRGKAASNASTSDQYPDQLNISTNLIKAFALTDLGMDVVSAQEAVFVEELLHVKNWSEVCKKKRNVSIKAKATSKTSTPAIHCGGVNLLVKPKVGPKGWHSIVFIPNTGGYKLHAIALISLETGFCTPSQWRQANAGLSDFRAQIIQSLPSSSLSDHESSAAEEDPSQGESVDADTYCKVCTALGFVTCFMIPDFVLG
jgi:hypothetical protein